MGSFLLAATVLLALPPTTDEIDRIVQSALERWSIPGLALVVVENDRVILLKGYGRESLNGKPLVSPDTVFPLASCSKPLTTTMLAALVDDGKLAWNDPVRKHLPYFQLKDPLASERATIRDLLCHRTGLGPHPLLWYHSPLSIEDRVRKLALLQPNTDFRTDFQYQTVAFGAAGLAAEQASGSTWPKLMTEKVFLPLGMASSSSAVPKNAKALAQPHQRGRDGVIRQIPRYPLDDPDPAGSIHTTARDLAPFLRMQLAEGRFEGKQIIAPERVRELQQPNIVIPMEGLATQLNPETVQISYGLGWIVQDYRGRKMTLHGGAIDGFRAHLVLVPEASLGIGVLSNLDGALGNIAVANAIVDRFLGATPRDWCAEIWNFEEGNRQRDAKRSLVLRKQRPADAQPLKALRDYAAVYEDEAYGVCEIVQAEKGLELRWRTMRSALEHYVGHVFIADDPPFREAPIEFITAKDGSIRELRFLDRSFVRKEK